VLTASQQGGVDWPVLGSPATTLGEFLTVSHVSPYPAWWLVALWLLGLITVRRLRNLAWWLGTGLVFTALFVLDASYKSTLIATLTRPWWNDSWRLEALATSLLVTLAASGLVAALDAGISVAKSLGRVRFVERIVPTRVTVLRAGVFAMLLVVLAALTHGLYLNRNSIRLASLFENGPTMSDAKRTVLDKLRDMVPADSLVMNDPQDGSPLMWALDGVHPVFGHAMMASLIPELGHDRQVLLASFNKLDTDPAVRSAVRALNVRYVFVGDGFVTEESTRLPSLTGLDRLGGLRLVYASTEGKIYKILDGPTPNG